MRRPASVLKPASDEPSPQGALPPPAGTQENAPPSPGADSPAAESVQASTEPVTKDSPPLDRARDVVHRFLEAPSWKERVGLIEVSGDPAAALSSYYQNHADLPLTNYRLDYFHTETRPGDNGAAYIFFLTYANETDGFPVMVMENRGEFRLDWDLFLEFRERTFQHFVEESQEKPGTFRVVLQRVTYWESDRDQIPLVDQLLCYKIDPPYPGFTRFAFVDRDTPIGKQLAKDLSWESDPLAAEVQLRWSTFPGGKSYLTIDQMVSRTWVRPLPPGMLGKSATAKN
jgi:hypothetical protein